MLNEPLKITINGNEFTLPVHARFGDYTEYGSYTNPLRVKLHHDTALIQLHIVIHMAIPIEIYGNGVTLESAISSLETRINEVMSQLKKYSMSTLDRP